MNSTKILFSSAFILISAAVIFGQNRFEGYSFVLDANTGGACPIQYLSGVADGNAVDVYIAGTKQRQQAQGLTPCDESRVNGNQVAANGLGRWCFQGPEDFYDIKLKNGDVYLWYSVTKNTGFYSVKDFRPVTRTPGPDPRYIFSDPADYTKTIKNALVFIAARLGGTLKFPDGDYIVGTTDGNTRDPNYQALTVPSGITIEGASSNISVPTTTLPISRTATRIRLRNDNQAIFRIGGCTNQVTVRNIELLGNVGLAGEAPRNSTGTYGIEAMGKWAINPATNQHTPNSSQIFRFENITFQSFDRAIFAHNANDQNCKAQEQACFQWQFDYVKVDHALFNNNKTGIWIDTYNTDWKITNSFLSYTASNAPGDGIRIQKAGSVLIEQTFGGGYDYGAGMGGTFINLDTIGTLTVIGSGSERSRRSLYTNPAGSISSLMITVIGSVFGDPVELSGRLNYISSGNFYLAKTLKADPNVIITSTGDRFCYDSLVLPGRCKDAAGAAVSNPGISGGRIMFQSGRLGEGAGANKIESRPNFFGYNVEIGDGLLQFDPNITFKDITNWTNGVDGRPRISDGALVYCKDCRKSNSGTCTQGNAGPDGAFAKRINGQWRCD